MILMCKVSRERKYINSSEIRSKNSPILLFRICYPFIKYNLLYKSMYI